jgi:fatty acid desaturase
MVVAESSRKGTFASVNALRTAAAVVFYVALLGLVALVRGPALAVVLPVVGIAQYRLYFPVHEASHRLLFSDPKLNDLAGRLLAALLFTSLRSFREEHMAHHRYFGTARDPGAPDYRVQITTRPQLLRFLLAPLAGGTVAAKVRNLLEHGEHGGGRAKGVQHLLAGASTMIAVQLMIACAVTFPTGELWRYPLFVVAPFVTVFLFLSRLRMFLEHAAFSPSGGTMVADGPLARTFEGAGWDARLLSGWNFRFHHEHHRQPTLSSNDLSAAHALGTGAIGRKETAASYFGALGELWRTLR